MFMIISIKLVPVYLINTLIEYLTEDGVNDN